MHETESKNRLRSTDLLLNPDLEAVTRSWLRELAESHDQAEEILGMLTTADDTEDVLMESPAGFKLSDQS
ncbi:MAG: hypothetical protein M3Q81_01630 [bacterium]|nr:hypothetical protein [bacterium]